MNFSQAVELCAVTTVADWHQRPHGRLHAEQQRGELVERGAASHATAAPRHPAGLLARVPQDARQHRGAARP